MMRAIVVFLLVFVISLVAGAIVGIMIYSSHVDTARKQSLVEAQLVLSEGHYEEARAIALNASHETFSPFSILDIVGWSYFCLGEQDLAFALWQSQADFYRNIEFPIYQMYEEKLSFITGGTQFDEEKRAFYEAMLVCPPGAR